MGWDLLLKVDLMIARRGLREKGGFNIMHDIYLVCAGCLHMWDIV